MNNLTNDNLASNFLKKFTRFRIRSIDLGSNFSQLTESESMISMSNPLLCQIYLILNFRSFHLCRFFLAYQNQSLNKLFMKSFFPLKCRMRFVAPFHLSCNHSNQFRIPKALFSNPFYHRKCSCDQ